MALGNQQDFEMHSGNDRDLVVTTRNAAGTVVDISGATIIQWRIGALDASQASPTPKNETALVLKALTTGIAITDGPNGVFTVTLAAADTEGLRGDYYHEARIVLSSKNSTVMFGKLTIKRNLIPSS